MILAFWSTGNALITRGNAMDHFSSIMERGVKVNLIYGDRDYLCNYMSFTRLTRTPTYSNNRDGRRERQLIHQARPVCGVQLQWVC